MVLRYLFTAAAAVVASSSCASAPPVTADPGSANVQSPNVYPTMKSWVGSLNPTRSYSAAAVATQRQNAYGRAELTVSPDNPTITHVVLKVSVPNEPGLDMAGWGLSEGRCGSGNPLVLSPSAFQPIPVNPGGQGPIDVSIPFVIPDKGLFHISIFRSSGTQLSDLVSCAELRRES
jgi:hypothetical protein